MNKIFINACFNVFLNAPLSYIFVQIFQRQKKERREILPRPTNDRIKKPRATTCTVLLLPSLSRSLSFSLVKRERDERVVDLTFDRRKKKGEEKFLPAG